AGLPLFAAAGAALSNGWLALAPRDHASQAIGWALRGATSLALATLLFALAGPHRPEYHVERVGQGAEIVLLLDRSRSMDQGFAPGRAPPKAAANSPEMLEYYFSQAPARLREPKGQVARQLLAEFTAQRPDDRFALIAFSTLPMRVLDFTARREVIQAAIDAGNIGRGLSETNIGRALELGLEMFEGRPYNGSRIIMLVSDGGDRMDPDTRERLSRLARKQRVSIYWLYLRSANSPGLTLAEGDSDAAAAAESIPEILLNSFFNSLETPYRAYEASDSRALQRAIDDVNRQEKLPITYDELVPRRDLAPYAHALALAAVLLLLAVRLTEIRRWA
ncbi:vWA domain-containing protein, partial [Variovorax sp. YR752]|uniref:vWA domain-containing protein n=1 Tax=Variovorax sp. YR752 TaxID=1884383 RepID=UPI003137E0D6